MIIFKKIRINYDKFIFFSEINIFFINVNKHIKNIK
jgi:hypothetical protein